MEERNVTFQTENVILKSRFLVRSTFQNFQKNKFHTFQYHKKLPYFRESFGTVVYFPTLTRRSQSDFPKVVNRIFRYLEGHLL